MKNLTDVSGFFNCRPSWIVKDPKTNCDNHYKELRELSYMGASVLHQNSIFPVRNGIPILIKNTNSPEDQVL